MKVKVYLMQDSVGWLAIVPLISQATRGSTREEAIHNTTICLRNRYKWYLVVVNSNRNSADKYDDREELAFDFATGAMTTSWLGRINNFFLKLRLK